MDISFELWHSRVRETRRHCPTTASAAHQSGVALEAGPYLPGCGPDGSILNKFPRALDAILPAQRQGWLEGPPHARTAPTTARPPEAGIDRAAERRSADLCLFRRCNARGRQWDGHRYCGTVTGASGFRSLVA